MGERRKKEATRILAEAAAQKGMESAADSKPSFIRPFGYETSGAQAQGGGGGGGGEATSKSASSSSSGLGREFKKQKTDEMPDPVVPRNLFQDGDEEMLTEEEMKRRREAKAETPKEEIPTGKPPAAEQDDFWKQMGNMFDSRLDVLGGHWATALATVENRLTAQIGSETEKRTEESAKMTERMDHITERIAALESKPQSSAKEETPARDTSQQGGAKGWRPKHIIFGGWPDPTPRKVVEREAAAWLRTTP